MRRLVCAFIVTNHRRQVFCSRGPIAINERLENTGNMITQAQLLFAQSLQSICNVYVEIPRVILLVTVFFIIQPEIYTRVNMVFIELYKPRVTHMKYIEGK